jgi:hypothetical protein
MKTITVFFILLPFFIQSQSVVVEKINECRSTTDSYFNNRCEVDLKIFGDEVRKNKYIRVSTIIKAVDDQNLELIGEEKKTKYAEISGSNASVTLNLMPTSRKAQVIKELSGEIAMFMPSEANGGIVKVKNLSKVPMIDLLPKLKDLDLVFLTKESVEKFKMEQKNKLESDLKKQPKDVQDLAANIFSIFDEYFKWGDAKNEVNFMINGEQEKIISLQFEKPNGDKITNNGYMSSGDFITYYFNEDIESNYSLNITVEPSAALKKIPFSIKNIELP